MNIVRGRIGRTHEHVLEFLKIKPPIQINIKSVDHTPTIIITTATTALIIPKPQSHQHILKLIVRDEPSPALSNTLNAFKSSLSISSFPLLFSRIDSYRNKNPFKSIFDSAINAFGPHIFGPLKANTLKEKRVVL
ncbi:unnamed protein product [Citrullus colocynthis]|uniref:Uncharacterized protein n=1 Tax=Citrullus colocynthis TaxID=252529 RepID=A0ABP0XQV6_9ROSI